MPSQDAVRPGFYLFAATLVYIGCDIAVWATRHVLRLKPGDLATAHSTLASIGLLTLIGVTIRLTLTLGEQRWLRAVVYSSGAVGIAWLIHVALAFTIVPGLIHMDTERSQVLVRALGEVAAVQVVAALVSASVSGLIVLMTHARTRSIHGSPSART